MGLGLMVVALAGCGGNEISAVEIADANARSALNEAASLRSRLDDLESRIDELESQVEQ